MSAARDTCPGCGRKFSPAGFSNHLRFSHDPRCSSLRGTLLPRYTISFNPPPNPPGAPSTAAPDVQMLDISNQELELQPDTFPSPSHSPTSMHIEDNDDENSNAHGSDRDNTTHCSDDSSEDDNNMVLGEGGQHTDQVLETVFCRLSQPTPATANLDTESEASDDEEEVRPQPASQPSHGRSEGSGQMEPSTGQAGKYSNLTLKLPSDNCRNMWQQSPVYHQIWWKGWRGATGCPRTCWL